MTAVKHSRNKLTLPKGYLSYSQWKLWQKDPKEYKRQYFYGGDGFTNSGMDFGKVVAEAIEHGTNDPELQMLLDVLPRYEEVEHKIDTMVDGVPVIGSVDTYGEKENAFREYKTGRRTRDGKAPWDAVKVRKHEQLVWYALCLNGVRRIQCHLDWIETHEDEDGVHLTGHIESFERVIEPWEVKRLKTSIVKVAEEISAAYQKEAMSI